jgi:RHS repeat-associated protein
MNQYGLKPTGTSSIIDQLSYHYMAQSNKLLNVVDQANDANSTLGDFKYDPNITKTENTVDYTYDGNGNMISDQNKKITNIVYNILNLPSQITIPSKGIIRYYYDATGNKLQKRTLDNTISPSRTTVTNYIGGAVYQNDTLQFFGTPEGRVRANEGSSGWLYDYFLKDHLGNTRMMITDDYNVASPILEAYSYYPFGLQQKGIGLIQTGPLHNFKNTFQRQEFNEDLRIDVYEFKYRMDDPQIGRFWQVDPLADKYEYNSTYAFSENKVTSHVELEGLEAKYFLYFLRHPIAASDIGDYQKGSTNISTNSIRFSTRGVDPESGSILQENSSHEGSQVNAFRHTLWQSTITSKYDADLAKSAGDIHEDNPSVDLTIRKFAGKGALDKADQSIDLLNNQIGRSIGEANPKASMNDLASKTLEFFHEKGLYTATINKDGSVTITQTKISDKQYLTLQKVIKTLDQNGFTPQEQKQREITGKQEQERQKLLQTIPPIM